MQLFVQNVSSTATTSAIGYFFNAYIFNDIISLFTWGIVASAIAAPFWLLMARKRKGRKDNDLK